MSDLFTHVDVSAVISECGIYRYRLERKVAPSWMCKTAAVIMTLALPSNRDDRHEPGRRLPIDPATQKIVALRAQYDLYWDLLEACLASSKRVRAITSPRQMTEERVKGTRISTHSTGIINQTQLFLGTAGIA